MQIVSCSVRLKGSLNHVVTNKIVSVPELRILRQIHGVDAIQDVKVLRTDANFDHENHRIELQRVYEQGINSDPEQVGGLVNKLFGPFGKLPTNLIEVGINPKAEAARLRAEAAEKLRVAERMETAGAGEIVDSDEADGDAFDDYIAAEGEDDTSSKESSDFV